jgi:hypothetical protein
MVQPLVLRTGSLEQLDPKAARRRYSRFRLYRQGSFAALFECAEAKIAFPLCVDEFQLIIER